VRLPVIGNVDVEYERAFRPDVAAVVDLRHDLVAEIQSHFQNNLLFLPGGSIVRPLFYDDFHQPTRYK
jgi:hypothetical protein